MKGKMIDMKGTSSWSSSQKVANDFAKTQGNYNKGVVFSVKNKSGTNITHLSNFPKEKEVIQPSTAKYKIKNIVKRKNYM